MLWQDPFIALLTLADLGERGQLRVGKESEALLTSGFGGRVVVVKVAHHGSADQAPEFYEAIKPSLALISVGEHNSYGHPTKRALDMLSFLGTQVLRTDESGAIGVSESEGGLTVSVSGRS
jgi:competence protein ComEC